VRNENRTELSSNHETLSLPGPRYCKSMQAENRAEENKNNP
jgi:hypothetical protein